jgi:hypothetical protein
MVEQVFSGSNALPQHIFRLVVRAIFHTHVIPQIPPERQGNSLESTAFFWDNSGAEAAWIGHAGDTPAA